MWAATSKIYAYLATGVQLRWLDN